MIDKSKSSVQDTLVRFRVDFVIDAKPNKRVHHRIEQACSRIETVYVFRLFYLRLVYPYRTESSIGQRFNL